MPDTMPAPSPIYRFGDSRIEPHAGRYSKIELEITLRCNYQCFGCNRLVGQFDLPESDMTLEQIGRFTDDVRSLPFGLEYITVMGGEPLVHPRFDAILEMLHEELVSPGMVGRLVLCSNGLKAPTRLVRQLNVEERTASHIRHKRHANFYQSPADNGWPIKSKCHIPDVWCGIALNAWGYWPCGPGSSLARLFHWPSYARHVIPTDLSTWDYAPLCRHCVHMAHERRDNIDGFDLLPVLGQSGKQLDPSPTFAQAFAQWRDQELPSYRRY